MLHCIFMENPANQRFVVRKFRNNAFITDCGRKLQPCAQNFFIDILHSYLLKVYFVNSSCCILFTSSTFVKYFFQYKRACKGGRRLFLTLSIYIFTFRSMLLNRYLLIHLPADILGSHLYTGH